MTEVEIETQPLIGTGDWFPYIPLPQDELQSGNWTKESIFIYRYNNPSECQITAESKVIVASIPFEDFMALTLESNIRVFLANTVITRFPLADLQQQYLNQVEWNGHKKQMVEEIVEQKSIRRRETINKRGH